MKAKHNNDLLKLFFYKSNNVLALSLVLFLFSAYLLVYRGGFHSIDEVSMFAVTENLVKFGQVNTNQIAWTQWTTSQAEAQGFFGRDGYVYSKKGFALSLAQAPLYWLGLTLPGLGMLQTVSLLNAFITAITGLLIFLLLRRMDFSLATALITTLVFAFATIAFIYAKYLFSEPLAGLFLLLATYMLFVNKQESRWYHLFIAGLAAGFAVLTRANNLFLLPIFGLYLLATASPIKPDLRNARLISRYLFQNKMLYQAAIIFGLGLTIPGVILFAYNTTRAGNPFQTGYDLTLFSSNIFLGLYKLLFSPLRGLFIYSPILLLSLPGWRSLLRRYPAEAWLFAGLTGITLTLFSAWSSGEGLSWGSRFLVPLIPFFTLSLAPIIDQLTTKPSTHTEILTSQPPHPTPHTPRHAPERSLPVGRTTYRPPRITHYVLRITFYPLLLLSLLLQILGLMINPWVFLARIQAEFGGEFFLENTAALYDFRYSQILGQIQNWAPENSDLAWWQPWGFDLPAFGLSLGLVLYTGWLLWQNFLERQRRDLQTSDSDLGQIDLPVLAKPIVKPRIFIVTLKKLIPVIMVLAIAYSLLIRYYQTDRQFGPPEDGYTAALQHVAGQAGAPASIITVAPYHYHVPMNRFKARLPLIGFAQQRWPLPETALPLLAAVTKAQNIWQVTVGFPPAAEDNAAEQWLTANAFKVGDDWFPDNVRLAQFSPAQPASAYPINITFDHEIRLLKANLNPKAQAGQPFPVEFIWLPTVQPKVDYHLFLQLLNSDGALVAQHDGPPGGGYSPTSTWRVGQEVVSRQALMLAGDLQAGDYHLIAGLYNPASGQRLLIDDETDFIDLGLITVAENKDVES